jgi:hypothetical protein
LPVIPQMKANSDVGPTLRASSNGGNKGM